MNKINGNFYKRKTGNAFAFKCKDNYYVILREENVACEKKLFL